MTQFGKTVLTFYSIIALIYITINANTSFKFNIKKYALRRAQNKKTTSSL